MTDIETAIEIVRTTTPCHTLSRQGKAVMAGKILVERIRELEAELAEITAKKDVSDWESLSLEDRLCIAHFPRRPRKGEGDDT